MVYEETGGGAHYDVGDHDPRRVPAPDQPPSQELWSQIVKLGSQPAWTPERVKRELQIKKNLDVPLNTIRHVLQQAKPA